MSVTGWKSGDGKWTLVAGVVVVGRGGAPVDGEQPPGRRDRDARRRCRRRRPRALRRDHPEERRDRQRGLAVRRHRPSRASSGTISPSRSGIGIWLCIAGGVVAIVAGIMAMMSRATERRRRWPAIRRGSSRHLRRRRMVGSSPGACGPGCREAVVDHGTELGRQPLPESPSRDRRSRGEPPLATGGTDVGRRSPPCRRPTCRQEPPDAEPRRTGVPARRREAPAPEEDPPVRPDVRSDRDRDRHVRPARRRRHGARFVRSPRRPGATGCCTCSSRTRRPASR